jgi:adenosine deaminase
MRALQHGIPVALCIDDPVQICTTIGREYAIAHTLGFSAAALLDITRTAIQASFAPEERRAALLTGLRGGNDSAAHRQRRLADIRGHRHTP